VKSTPAPAPASSPVVAATAASVPSDPPARGVLDLRGQVSELALLQLGQRVLSNDQVEFIVDHGPIERHLRAWANAISAKVELVPFAGGLRGSVRLDTDERAPVGPLGAQALVQAQSRAGFGAGNVAARRNKASLMVLHSDFEPVLASLMFANASAAQGMEVEMFFAFWGVNVLRAGVPRRAPERPIPFMKRMMKWMMPAGPDVQQLSKMNMGGMGVEMMKFFMKQDNIMGIRDHLVRTAEGNVKLVACTMSMGLMGIDKGDLLDLPNISFGGITGYSAAARESAVTLVF
jgi:peroxiredoxin family protein